METDCYCTTVRVAARRLTAAYDAALRPAGISAAQLAMLRSVASAGPLSVTKLADRLELERSTAARNVRVLAGLGLVRIGRSGRDRREAEVHLGPGGEQALAQAEPLWAAAQRGIEQRLGANRAADLRSRLRAI